MAEVQIQQLVVQRQSCWSIMWRFYAKERKRFSVNSKQPSFHKTKVIEFRVIKERCLLTHRCCTIQHFHLDFLADSSSHGSLYCLMCTIQAGQSSRALKSTKKKLIRDKLVTSCHRKNPVNSSMKVKISNILIKF